MNRQLPVRPAGIPVAPQSPLRVHDSDRREHLPGWGLFVQVTADSYLRSGFD